MDRRRLLLNAQKQGEEPYLTLPDGYTALKAIKTDGNAYLDLYANTDYNDTNYITLTAPYKIVINNVNVKDNTIDYSNLLGFFSNLSNTCGSIVASGFQDFRVFFADRGWVGPHPIGSFVYGDYTKITIDVTTSQIATIVNGVKQTVNNSINFPFQRLYMFGQINAWSNVLERCEPNTEIGRTTIYQDETKLYDLIPCINANGVVCMWDAVSNKDFVNANSSGTFTAVSQE